MEELAAEAAIAATTNRRAEKVTIERRRSTDSRNAALRDKYARTRDPAVLLIRDASRTWREALVLGTNLVGHLRRRHSLVAAGGRVQPDLGFQPRVRGVALQTLATRPMDQQLTRDPAGGLGRRSGRLQRRARAGADLRRASPERLGARGDDLAGSAFSVAGVPLWHLVRPRLLELIDGYAEFASGQAPRLRRQLTRWDVEAVLVPYDNNPAVRLLVRVAQSLDIPDVRAERRL